MPDFTAERGKQYEIRIEARQNDSEVLPGVVSQIEGWANGESKDTENSDSSAAIHVSALSFATSNVYRIYRDGVPVVDVCKEYLISSGMSGTAIVAYPLTEAELPDLSNGFLLQMPDMPDVPVGGKISWDKKTNSFTYPGGSKQVIERFYLDEKNAISLVMPATPIKVNVVSHPLTDMRHGEVQVYPIVKIGVQYWMKEDLRATYYRDGTALEHRTVTDGSPGYYQPEGEEYYFYNGEALMAGELSPDGWKIPSADEWKLLQAYINGEAAVLKMGEWQVYNATNELQPVTNLTEFSATPNGQYLSDGWKAAKQLAAYWAMGNEKKMDVVPYLEGGKSNIQFAPSNVTGQTYYKGLSIRCIKIN
jgi:uncharacterized protein (TIGR02145 family)